MKNKNRFKMAILIFFAASLLFTIPVETIRADINHEEQNDRADDLVWKYKIINGKKYKRLFNVDKGVWVGDWILIG